MPGRADCLAEQRGFELMPLADAFANLRHFPIEYEHS